MLLKMQSAILRAIQVGQNYDGFQGVELFSSIFNLPTQLMYRYS